jgi:hypothetical protein
VVAAASELIKLEPYGDNGYYLRAMGLIVVAPLKAIDDYVTASNCSETRQTASASYLGAAKLRKAGSFSAAHPSILGR